MSMLKVIIDRKTWLRGQGADDSQLLIPDELIDHVKGQMCCLGFACLAAGMSKDQIRGIQSPYGLDNPPSFALASSRAEMDSPINCLMTINDAIVSDTYPEHVRGKVIDSEAARERLIVEYGLKAGIEFSFNH